MPDRAAALERLFVEAERWVIRKGHDSAHDCNLCEALRAVRFAAVEQAAPEDMTPANRTDLSLCRANLHDAREAIRQARLLLEHRPYYASIIMDDAWTDEVRQWAALSAVVEARRESHGSGGDDLNR